MPPALTSKSSYGIDAALSCEGWPAAWIMKSGRWEYADRVGSTGAVVIAGVTGHGSLILTEQFRIPVNQRVIELPAGIAGDIPGHEEEELAIAARRELLDATEFTRVLLM